MSPQPNAIVVAHLCPFPKTKGNAARLLGLLEWLRSKGFRLVFVLQPLDVDDAQFIPQLTSVVDELIVVRPGDAADRMRRAVELPARIGRRLLSAWRPSKSPASGPASDGEDADLDAYCWPATIRAVASAARRRHADLVVSEYAFFSRCLASVPSATIKVIDTVEVFSRNIEQFAAAGVVPNLVCSRDSERIVLERADLVVAIQHDDADFLKTLLTTKPVITLGHVYSEARPRAASPLRGAVLYVGSSNEYNRHGLEMFVAHAWPTIRAACPQAELHIIGEARPSGAAANDGVRLLGRVSDEELAACYQTAHVVINPQVAGTGLKIKCVEALSAGCPLVVNDAGADGLREGAGQAFLVAQNWDHFAHHVVRLLRDDAVRLSLESAARRFAVQRFSRSAVFGEFEKFLDQRLGHVRRSSSTDDHDGEAGRGRSNAC